MGITYLIVPFLLLDESFTDTEKIVCHLAAIRRFPHAANLLPQHPKIKDT